MEHAYINYIDIAVSYGQYSKKVPKVSDIRILRAIFEKVPKVSLVFFFNSLVCIAMRIIFLLNMTISRNPKLHCTNT